LHGRIDSLDRGARQVRFRPADISKPVNRLAMQITGIERVGVDQTQETDTRTRQILHDGTAQASQAHDEDAG
jgi:hypothetical protein